MHRPSQTYHSLYALLLCQTAQGTWCALSVLSIIIPCWFGVKSADYCIAVGEYEFQVLLKLKERGTVACENFSTSAAQLVSPAATNFAQE